MLLFPALLRAQGEPAPSDVPETPQNAGAGEWRGKGAIAIREVPVWGRRPMKSIGVEETKLDSAILKENIALSMADALTFNTPVFVKQYGRATLSTVSFRGTGPSHTQVTWNGMRINNADAGHDRLFDDPLLFHRRRLAAPRHLVGQRDGRRTGRYW